MTRRSRCCANSACRSRATTSRSSRRQGHSNGEKSHGREEQAEAEVRHQKAQPLRTVRKIARVPSQVRRLPYLLPRLGALGLHPGRAQGELVTIHFYASLTGYGRTRNKIR